MSGGLAAGAKAGAAFGPWGAAIGGAAGLAGDLAQDSGVSQSGTGQFDLRNSFDGSGWTVSTGKSTATGSRRTQSGEPASMWSQAAPAGFGAGGMGMDNPMIWLGLVAAAVAVYMVRR